MHACVRLCASAGSGMKSPDQQLMLVRLRARPTCKLAGALLLQALQGALLWAQRVIVLCHQQANAPQLTLSLSLKKATS